MEELRTEEQAVSESVVPAAPEGVRPAGGVTGNVSGGMVVPSCDSCGGGAGAPDGKTKDFVYALGQVNVKFPNLSVEKEYMQVSANVKASSDRQRLIATLKQNSYLARAMCWVLTIDGVDTYILQPRTYQDFDQLVNALAAEPTSEDHNVVVGVKAGIAPATMCNGLLLPICKYDVIYAFDTDSLVKTLEQSLGAKSGADEGFRDAAVEVFRNLSSLTHTEGGTPEHRAITYLAVRYNAIYKQAAALIHTGNAFTGIEVRPAALGGEARTIVTVIFTFVNLQTNVTQKWACSVDVTEEFPFMATGLAQYFSRN